MRHDAIVCLELFIMLSGLGGMALSSMSFLAAMRERHALRVRKLNGGLAATALQHLTTSLFRLFASGLSMVGGVALMWLPDFSSRAGVVAGTVWLIYNAMMIYNLALERWARKKMLGETRRGGAR